MWSLVYLRRPDFINVGQWSAYTSKEIVQLVEMVEVLLHEAPSEMPGTTAVVEGYHAPLSLAYERIRAYIDCQNSHKECLRLAVFALTCTVRSERLCSKPSVLRTFLKPSWASPAHSALNRAKLIAGVLHRAANEKSRRRIAYFLWYTK